MNPDPLLSIKDAADRVGAKYWQLLRAVQRGRVPYFQPYNSRKLVRLSDVLALIEASKRGGNHE